MFCSPWDCRWNLPARPFVFRLVHGQRRKKSPPLPVHFSELRNEPKTRANMPSLRQLEFAFEQFAIRIVERHDTVAEQTLRRQARQTATEAVVVQLRGRDIALETDARQLLRSLGAKRIA